MFSSCHEVQSPIQNSVSRNVNVIYLSNVTKMVFGHSRSLFTLPIPTTTLYGPVETQEKITDTLLR